MQASTTRRGRPTGVLFDLLSFDRLLTGPVVHLIYWAGLLLIALFAFGVVGAAVGVAIRAGALEGVLLAIPLLVAGLLVAGALALIWRGVCEFFVAVFQIAEDLHALRLQGEAPPAPEPPRPGDACARIRPRRLRSGGARARSRQGRASASPSSSRAG